MTKGVATLLLLAVLSMQGCLGGAAVAVGEHAIRKGVSSDKGQQPGDYYKYCQYMASVNAGRATQSLPPLSVLSQEDWTRQQDLLKKYEKDKVSDKVTVKEILPEND